MPFDLSNVREASYKQAVFVMDASSISGGRKDVAHEFVNSDKQVVEDLGLRRKTYNITAIVHGENYEANRDRLLDVLEDGKKGTFVHPFEGNIENIVARSFTMVESFTEFGVATFSIVLAPSDDIAAPTQAAVTVSEVSTQKNSTMDVISESIESLYETTASLTGSIENNIGKATDFINNFEEATQGFQGISSVVNSLNNQIIEFSLSIASLVQNPVGLATSISNLFIVANNAYPNAIQTLGMMKDLFDFGGNDSPQLNISTAATKEINSNNDVFNYAINSYALANAYLQISSSTFSTISEIEQQESDLETQYDLITNLSELPQSIRNELTDLRATTSEVIEELKTTTPDLVPVDAISPLAIRKLEYLYYGDNTRTETLIAINDVKNIGFVNGGLQFLNDIV